MPDCRLCRYFHAVGIQGSTLHIECEKKQPVMMSSLDCKHYTPYKQEEEQMTNEDIKNKLRDCLFRRRHHKNEWDVYPAITRDLKYTYLDWEYDDNEIKVKTKDYDLIALIEEVIKIYLEEMEDNDVV